MSDHAIQRYTPQEFSLQNYVQQGCNVLVPTQSIREISPMHRLRLEVVQLSVNEDDKDVYRNKTFCKDNELALSKNGILKLARTAGVEFVPQLCRRIDDMKDPRYVCYEAVAFIRQPDGRPFYAKGMKEIDLREGGAEEARLRKQAAAKMRSWRDKPPELKSQAEADAWVAKELLAAAEHKLSNAETKAMLRAVRALLQIKPKYTMQELSRPFVVPHFDFTPDYNDPEVRRLMVGAAAQAQAGLYGEVGPGGPAQPMPTHVPTYTMDEIQEAVLVDSDEEDEASDPFAGDERRYLGTTLDGWLKSLRDAETLEELSAIGNSLRKVRAEIPAERWQQLMDAGQQRRAQLQGAA